MEKLKFRVFDGDELIGFETFNVSLNNGFMFIDLRECLENQTIGDLIVHSDSSTPGMLKSSNPFGQLTREQYTGICDLNNTEIYYNDVLRQKDDYETSYHIKKKSDGTWICVDHTGKEFGKLINLVNEGYTVVGNLRDAGDKNLANRKHR